MEVSTNPMNLVVEGDPPFSQNVRDVDCGDGSLYSQQPVRFGGERGAVSRRGTATSVRGSSRSSARYDYRAFKSFFVVRKINGDFSKVNPFFIERVIRREVGVVKSTKKVREGLLIEVANASQAYRIEKLKLFGEHPVEVSAHGRLNQTKGVITCRDLLNCPVDEIVEELKEIGVVDAKRITTRKNNQIEDTASVILTFERQTLPDRLKLAFYSLSVRPYIPAPMRCFRCQIFGHLSASCVKQPVCICGNPVHSGSPCQPPIKCINCKGDHSAISRDCPVFKLEQDIKYVQTIKKISYFDAKREVIGRNPSRNLESYAQVTTKPNQPSVDIKSLVAAMVPEMTKILSNILNVSNVSVTAPAPKPAPPIEIIVSQSATQARSAPDAQNNIGIFAIPQTPQSQSSLAPSHDDAVIETENAVSRAHSPAAQEKRKNTGESGSTETEESGTVSETSQASQSTKTSKFKKKKKKKGWPKGKPRK